MSPERIRAAWRWAGLWLADRVWRGKPQLPADGRKVLVVRLDALGDFVLWTREARVLASHYRRRGGARVTLLANDAWAELALASQAFDEVLPLDRRRFVAEPGYRRSLIERVRALRFGTVVNAQYTRELVWGEAIVATSGAPERIGQTGEIGVAARWLADRHYTRLVPSSGAPSELLRARHFTDALVPEADALRSAMERDAAPPVPRAGLPEAYFVVAPGAGWSARAWPPERFGEVAARVARATGWEPVLCGTAREAPLAAALRKSAPGVKLVDLTGRTSAAELSAVVARARFVLANESGIAHLAAAHGVRCVCVLGGGHFGRFMPYPPEPGLTAPRAVYERMDCYGCDWRCVHPLSAGGTVRCVDAVTVESVWQAAAEAIAPR